MENLATIKLTSGEELIAQVEEGPRPLEITVINPVVVHKNNSALGPMLSVSHWLMFTKVNKAVIKKSKVVALLYDLEDNTIEHYKRFTQQRGEVVTLDDNNRLEDMIQKTLKRALTGKGEADFGEYEEESLPEANTTIH
jgi:hypothetical protein